MSFKPQTPTQEYTGPRIDYNAVNKQVKPGQRPARVSLIVDLGLQRKTPSDVEYNPSNAKHQKLVEEGTLIEERGGKKYIKVPPSKESGQEIAVFADLVNDVVDYGEPLGKQPYRVMMNHQFKGDMSGIAFEGSYPYVEGKGVDFNGAFTFHPRSILTSLAKATGNTQIISGVKDDPNNMDVSQLLNGAFYAVMEVNSNGKSGEEERVYVNFKGAITPPPSFDDDGNEVPAKVKATTNTPMLISFDDVTEESAKFLNGMVVKKIKQAVNYPGSKMQKILEPNYQEAPATVATQEVNTQPATPAEDPFADFDDEPAF